MKTREEPEESFHWKPETGFPPEHEIKARKAAVHAAWEKRTRESFI
jgi:hypothetical protein